MKLSSFVCTHILIASTTFIASGCQSSPNTHKLSDASIGKHKPAASPSLLQIITLRDVDFGNFTYIWPEDLIEKTKIPKTFSLRNGELLATRDQNGFVDEMGAHLLSVSYGDVTSDKTEEAIIVLSFQTGGSSSPNCIYIYSWQNEQPRLLWSHTTGDRADGGLRRVYAENGKLVLETYSPIDKKADCCPLYFNRVRYIWRNDRFNYESKEERLSNPEGHGSPIV
jgi:hypothetical protein